MEVKESNLLSELNVVFVYYSDWSILRLSIIYNICIFTILLIYDLYFHVDTRVHPMNSQCALNVPLVLLLPFMQRKQLILLISN